MTRKPEAPSNPRDPSQICERFFAEGDLLDLQHTGGRLPVMDMEKGRSFGSVQQLKHG